MVLLGRKEKDITTTDEQVSKENLLICERLKIWDGVKEGASSSEIEDWFVWVFMGFSLLEKL